MNPQRLVAAVAALAIGFGVTLAGVIAADDSVPPAPPESQEDIDDAAESATDEATDDVDGAVQEEAPAAEPEPAEAEPAPNGEPDAEPPPADAPSQEAPSQPSEQSPPDPIDVGGECEVVYVVIGVEGDVAVLIDDDVFIASDGRLFLPGSDVSLDELENIAQIQVRVAAQDSDDDDVFVDCDDETLIAERNADDLLDEIERLLQATADVATPIGDVGNAASPDFPCGDSLLRSIERTYIEQFGLEVDAATDGTVVLVSLAQRITAVSIEFDKPENDLEFWVDELQGPFSGFRIDGEVSEACALLAENIEPTVSTRAGFFCGVGQLASDGQLLDFFDGLVPLPADCTYPEPDAGGFGSIRGDDQGEN